MIRIRRARPQIWMRREHLIAAALVAAGFALAAALIAATGGDVGAALAGWWHGAFGTRYYTVQTLAAATPLVLIAVGASVALRAGVIVVGAEGQMIAGAIAAAAVGLSSAGDTSAVVALPLGALAGAFGGAAWSLLPGVALVRWGVNEILSALLANYIAVQVLSYVLRTVLRDPAGAATPQSASLPDPALIPQLAQPGRLSAAAIVVLALVAAAAWWHRSRSALLLEVYARRRWLAERLDMTARTAVVTTTLISGASAGLAGWIQLAGADERLHPGISGGIGFSGLVVAVLGGGRPVPILLAGVGFAALGTGAGGIQLLTGTPAAIGTVVQALLLGAGAVALAQFRRSAARRAVQRPGGGDG
ncbi:ABC transporter permease [Amycolatopsis tolypomycina]|uniref:ABC transporter permease n=1 Tax=Amycolatopsis tolypomycina TaxID=208445 RepID=UPI0033BE424B